MKGFLTLCLALSFAVSLAPVQAHTVTVTDADTEKSVTLSKGDTLVVRLTANVTTGYSWHVVYDPQGPLRLADTPAAPLPHPSALLGSGSTQEYRFTIPQSASFERGGWLRLLSLRPFEPGVKSGKLWEIKYTIQAAK